ncbi:MAG: outer membrane beta-barrel protein [Porphyromonas sp.]|nr:outer membrane beta-barrel protein [Porphyromonas sp.]
MKKRLFALVALLAFALPVAASAQIDIFVKAGANLSQFPNKPLDIKAQDILSAHAGLGIEVGVPFLPLYADAALLYSRKGANIFDKNKDTTEKLREDLLIIPINAKLKVPFFESFGVVLFAGPNFAYSINNNFDKFKNQSFNEVKFSKASFGFQAGLGIELFEKLQITAQYEAPFKSDYKYTGTSALIENFYNNKNKTITLSAAYLF